MMPQKKPRGAKRKASSVRSFLSKEPVLRFCLMLLPLYFLFILLNGVLIILYYYNMYGYLPHDTDTKGHILHLHLVSPVPSTW